MMNYFISTHSYVWFVGVFDQRKIGRQRARAQRAEKKKREIQNSQARKNRSDQDYRHQRGKELSW